MQEAAKLNIDINPLDGASVAALVRTMYTAPAGMVDRVAKAMKPTS